MRGICGITILVLALAACGPWLGEARALAPGAASHADGAGVVPDVTLSISKDLIDSAGRVYTASGRLNISGLSPNNLTTAIFKSIMPAAFNACPDCPLSLALAVTVPPTATLTQATGAVLDVDNAAIRVLAEKSGSPVPLFLLSLNASCGLNFSNSPASSGSFIKVNVSRLMIRFSVEHSSVGPAPGNIISVLNPLINGFLDGYVIPNFNKDFPGIPIPSVSGVQIKNVQIQTLDGRVSVALSLDFGNLTKTIATSSEPHAETLQPGKLLLTQDTALPPGFTAPGIEALIGSAGLNKVLQALVPLIVAEVNGITIPGMSGKASGISYTINPIKIQGFSIGSSAISFEAGKGLLFSLSGVTLVIPSTYFRIEKRIIFKLHCSGHFGGFLAATDLAMHLNITSTAQGDPHITPNGQWTFGSLKVSEKMDHTICKVVQDIASWFVGNIDKKIEDAIRKMVPDAVNKLIADQGNKVLSDLVLSKRVDRWATVNFYFTQNPSSTSEVMEFDLSGEFVPTPPSLSEAP